MIVLLIIILPTIVGLLFIWWVLPKSSTLGDLFSYAENQNFTIPPTGFLFIPVFNLVASIFIIIHVLVTKFKNIRIK